MTIPRPSCVYLLDDDADFRSSTASALRSASIQVLEYTSAQAFLSEFNPSEPVGLLVDLEIADMDGPVLQKRLREMASWLPVIYTTGFPEVRPITAIMRAGAWNVLEKPVASTSLLESILDALEIAAQLHGYSVARAKISVRMSLLSKREREILELLIKGLCSREIALTIGNSAFTVEKQRANLMHKLQAKSLPELALMYFIAAKEETSAQYSGFFGRPNDHDDIRQLISTNPALIESAVMT